MKGIARLLCLPLVLAGCSRVASSTDDETSSGPESTTTTTTTSEQPSETETGEDPSTSSGPLFVPGFDVLGHRCDPWQQDCPDGEKCVPYDSGGGAWDSSKCVPIMGDQGPGEPCVYGGAVAATDDCRADSLCWYVDNMGVGTCALMCTGSPDEPSCPVGSSCTISSSVVIHVCVDGCDPLAQDCGEGFGCYWGNTAFSCVPVVGEGIEPGQPCGFINDCAPGSGCTPADVLPACADAACCTPFCSLDGGDGACAAVAGTTCVAFFEEGFTPSGYEEVGVCLQ